MKLLPSRHTTYAGSKNTLWIDPTYMLVFTVYLGMAEIFSDFPTGIKQNSQKWQKHMLFVSFLLQNLSISQASPDILQKLR